jgi:hypothetical protein
LIQAEKNAVKIEAETKIKSLQEINEMQITMKNASEKKASENKVLKEKLTSIESEKCRLADLVEKLEKQIKKHVKKQIKKESKHEYENQEKKEALRIDLVEQISCTKCESLNAENVNLKSKIQLELQKLEQENQRVTHDFQDKHQVRSLNDAYSSD